MKLDITVTRNARHQLGFVLDLSNKNVQIKRVLVLQPAEGLLQTGDFILSVDGVTVTAETAVHTIKTAGQTICFHIDRPN